MNAPSFFGEIDADVVALVFDMAPQVVHDLHELPGHLSFPILGTIRFQRGFCDVRRHGRLADVSVGTERAANVPGGGLPVEGSAVAKPSLEPVIVGARKLKKNHGGIRPLPKDTSDALD